MQTALAAAKAAKNATAQADIDKAANDLKAAIAALEKPVVVPTLDYTELEKQIVLAGALLAETYTADSWAALETALAAANAAKTDATTQVAIDEAATALKAAIAALELAPVAPTLDFSALDALIAQVEALNPDEYTPESWAILQEALADAKNAREDANAQVDIDNLAVSLQAAVSELEKVEVEYNLGWVIFWIILAVVVIAVAVVVIVLVLKKRNSGGLGTPGLD
jgi:flagellar biosynthesis/type III secretory pathway M-ring protein FliF/YscJ